jgi:hypothetical protein
MAKENRNWEYRRIQGALSNLGHEIGRGTIAEMLARHGDWAGARAGAEDHLEGVPRATLGPDRGRRFFHHRSLTGLPPFPRSAGVFGRDRSQTCDKRNLRL